MYEHYEEILPLAACNFSKEFIAILECDSNGDGGHGSSNHNGANQINLRIEIFVGILTIENIERKNDRKRGLNHDLPNAIKGKYSAILSIDIG